MDQAALADALQDVGEGLVRLAQLLRADITLTAEENALQASLSAKIAIVDDFLRGAGELPPSEA